MSDKPALTIAVITVSDRVSRGLRQDGSGPLAAELLSEFATVPGIRVVPDGVRSVQDAIAAAVRDGADVVLTTGGTGVSPRDLTPEATEPLLVRRMLGIENALRQSSASPHGALSRGLAGVADVDGKQAFVCNAPGSVGGVKDAVAALAPLLEHIVSQINGGDHTDTAHEEATRRVQNRGIATGSDASVMIAKVTHQPIAMADLIAAVDDPTAGAVTSFCGQVRNHDGDRQVTAIEYQAHPDAAKVVEAIAREVAASSGACKIAVAHRSGLLHVGDVALGAAVSASHRAESFRLLQEVVEQVKMRLPVWKKQQFADGTHEWTGAA